MNIIQLWLKTGNLDSQRAFYHNLLNLPIASEVDNQEIAFQAGTTQLTIQQADHDFHGVYHFAFNIPPNQLDEARDWLSQRVSLNKKPDGDAIYHFGSWNARAFYFYDPAGNILELIARHDLPKTTLAPFSGLRLLNVSEIGLVSEDVRATVVAAQANLGMSVYRGEVNDEFTPLGDEYGLLIVVKKGRLWFAETSSIGAESSPLEALLEISDGRRYTLSGPPYQFRLA